MFYLLLCLGALVLVFYVREKLRAYSVTAVLLKSAVSFLFIAVAVYGAYRGGGGVLCPFVLLGLVCGLLGDVWLDLKYVYPAQDTVFTYAGFYAFSLGHVFYIAGMLLAFYPAGRPLYAVLPLVLGALMGFANAALEKPMKLDYGKLRRTVVLYGALLFSSVLLSGSLALAYGFGVTSLNLLFAGLALFAASDLVLSGTYFGVGRDRPVDIILNYATYYPGQFLIASALLFLK